jgi:hypothetical protein
VIGIIFVLGGDQNDPNVLKSRDEFANNVIPWVALFGQLRRAIVPNHHNHPPMGSADCSKEDYPNVG